MMELEAGLYDVAPAGSVSQLLSANKQRLSRRELNEHCHIIGRATVLQPTLPRALYSSTPYMAITM